LWLYLVACPVLPVLASDLEPGTGDAPKLLLANTYQADVDLSQYWVSEKLDGVRAYWDGESLTSRGGRPIRPPAWFTEGFPRQPLDGELWMGRGTFDRMSAAARQEVPDPEVWRQVSFMVFDLPASPAPFGQRLSELRELLLPPPSLYLALIDQFRVSNHDALMDHLAAVISKGGEGLMLHREDSLYRAGRSDDLLKVKPYLDAEARVIAHLPGKGRLEGMLGALLVEEGNGTRFRLGGGFTDAQRRSPPPIGSLVTFKYQGRTVRGLPRFASFLRPKNPE
jgi:DNA ligase-1